ncbi:PAS domain-containing protein [Shimia sp.]|uniref:PAS domain-containing protein n=1 Tax=Shimia sp. TaxID=1954381 RepID=UPI00356439E7
MSASDDRIRDRDGRKRRPGAQPGDRLAVIEGYWTSLRGGGAALPTRSEIDPGGFAEALQVAFLLDRVAPGVARFRIAGSAINDLLGLDARGLPLTAVFDRAAQPPLRDLAEAVFREPARARLRLHRPARFGQPELGAAMLLLPLVSPCGEITGVFGGLETDRPVPPGRRIGFTLTSSFLRSLSGGASARRRRYPLPTGRRPLPALGPAPGALRLVAETPKRALPVRAHGKTGRPMGAPLRLVVDNGPL